MELCGATATHLIRSSPWLTTPLLLRLASSQSSQLPSRLARRVPRHFYLFLLSAPLLTPGDALALVAVGG